MTSDELTVFVGAAGAGSLSEAARRLALTPMIASRRLAALEADLGVRLMHRTTRSVSLTPEGEAFLPHARALLDAAAEARASVGSDRTRVAGLLRITAPAAFGRKVVTPLLAAFLGRHPALRVELQLTDAIVDIVASGIDVAVRIGRLRDSSLVARRIAPNSRLLCAAPAYLAGAGVPESADDLARHACLVLSGTTHWRFAVEGRARDVRVSGPFGSNSIEAIHAACVGGLGLTLLSAWDVADDLRSGALVRVDLAAAEPDELAIWAVYPSARHVAPKLRAFLDALGGIAWDDPRDPASLPRQPTSEAALASPG